MEETFFNSRLFTTHKQTEVKQLITNITLVGKVVNVKAPIDDTTKETELKTSKIRDR